MGESPRSEYAGENEFIEALPRLNLNGKLTADEVSLEQSAVVCETAGADSDLFRECKFSFPQARALAEGGLIEGLSFSDGKIVCEIPEGVSFAIGRALEAWGFDSPDYSGACRLGLHKKTKIAGPGDIVKIAVPKSVSIVYNFLRIGPRLILKSIFELLRANMITRLLSAAALLSFDTYHFIRGQISRKQYLINIALALLLLVGGAGGWMLGSAAAGFVLPFNTVLSVCFGFVGACLLGTGLGAVWKKLLSFFVKDDAAEILKLCGGVFARAAEEYLLNESEIADAKSKIKIDKQKIFEIYASGNKERFAESMIIPCVAEAAMNRKRISKTP